MKIAIQGLAGSFHALAAQRLFGEDIELIYCKTFKEVFRTLEDNKCERAVVAVENSLYGSINQVYDLLLKHHFFITHECYEQISLYLLGSSGASLTDITDVYSQAPALSEAELYLDTKLPNAERHEHYDTALAAKEVADWQDHSKAAIAGKSAARLYNLDILAAKIETHSQNYTRFIALSKQAETTPSAEKASLTFQTADTPGSLYAALGVFAEVGANLTKLESRPIIGAAWQYMYYVDFIKSIDVNLDDILSKLENHASNIRVLGNYKPGIFEDL